MANTKCYHLFQLTVLVCLFASSCLSDSAKPSPEAMPAIDYVTSTKFVKSTKQWCDEHEGEYVAIPGLTEQDLVDCRLPPTRGETSKILGNAFDYLPRTGMEKPGYGLYSYVLLPNRSSRGERLLQEMFKTTSFVSLVQINTENLNLIYLPTQTDRQSELVSVIKHGEAPNATEFAEKFFDYALSEKLLAQICTAPATSVQSVCESDLSRGPYLFTYVKPASSLSPTPPPYLFVDLSNVHEEAFSELITAYKEQVKRSDYSDMERIDNFKQRLLNVILTMADTLGTVNKAVEDAIHMVTGKD